MSTRDKKFWFGVNRALKTHDVTPATIEPPEGTEVIVTELVVLNHPFEVLLIDGRVGEELLPFDGPMDLNFFQGEHTAFEVGKITPDNPLRLYLQPFGMPSVLPHLNFAVVGWAKDWVAPKVRPEHKKRVGELVVSDYKQWLGEQGIAHELVHLFMDPLEAYLQNADLPDAAKTPGFSVLSRYLRARGILGAPQACNDLRPPTRPLGRVK